MRPVTLAIMPENTEQKVADGWNFARQRDFTGGETLALLPEKIGRNQLIRMENAITSPEGLITEAWQMDTPLFINATTGIVVVPIPGSKLFTVYAAAGEYVVSFTFDPNSPTPYDLADASGYPGYRLLSHAAPVTISRITHGTPFLGKHYCCAVTSLFITDGQLTFDPAALDFGTVQTRTVNLISVTVTNTTAGDISLTGVSFEGAGSGSYGHSGAFPQVLAPAGEYTFDVVFNPSAPATDVATLNLANTIGIVQVPITGTAESKLSVLPVSHDFGLLRDSATALQIFTVSNAGGIPATVLAVSIEGDGSGMVANTPALPYGATVPAGGSLDVPVVFTASAVGPLAATARVETDLGSVSVDLTGTAAPMPTIHPEMAGFLRWIPPIDEPIVPITDVPPYPELYFYSRSGYTKLRLENVGPGAITLTGVNVVSAHDYKAFRSDTDLTVLPLPVVLNAGEYLNIAIYSLDIRVDASVSVITDVITFNVPIARGM